VVEFPVEANQPRVRFFAEWTLLPQNSGVIRLIAMRHRQDNVE